MILSGCVLWGRSRTAELALITERWFLSGCYRKAVEVEGPPETGDGD
jgi:hypothetical protein